MGENKDPGYRIPDPVDPGEVVCIRVYVPKDTLYIGAFWRSYEFLTTWIAWERDPTHKAALVAELWRALFQQARNEFELEQGCGLMDVRQNEMDPCQLDKTDDGIEWQAWANLQLCPPQMTVSPDGSIWWWNPTAQDGAGGWEPLPLAAGATVTPTVPAIPPYPVGSPEYEDDTAQCIAAANLADAIKAGVRELVDTWIAVENMSVLVIIALGTLAALASGGALIPLAIALIGLSGGIEVIMLEDDFNAFDWPELRDIIYCRLDRTGSLSENGKNSLLSDIADFSYPIGNQIEWLIHAIILNVTAAGLTQDARIPYTTIDPDCDGAECDWYHLFNYVIEDGGFSQNAPDFPYGVWAIGGWDTTDNLAGCCYRRGIDVIRGEPESFRIVELFMTYDLTLGDFQPDPQTALVLESAGAAINIDNTAAEEGVEKQLYWSGDVMTSYLRVGLNSSSNDTDPDYQGSGKIRRLLVHGKGFNPYE